MDQQFFIYFAKGTPLKLFSNEFDSNWPSFSVKNARKNVSIYINSISMNKFLQNALSVIHQNTGITLPRGKKNRRKISSKYTFRYTYTLVGAA